MGERMPAFEADWREGAVGFAMDGTAIDGGASEQDPVVEVAREIRAMSRDAALQLYVDIGRLLVERFYGGDLGKARSHAAKDASLRRLASQPDMRLGRSGLSNAIRMHEFVVRRGGVHTCGHLGPSHVRALLPVPEDVQGTLLDRAVEESWTVQEIEAAAREARPGRRGAGGRPPAPAFVKAVRALQACAEEHGACLGDLDEVARMEPAQARALLAAVEGLAERLEAARARIEAQVVGVGAVWRRGAAEVRS